MRAALCHGKLDVRLGDFPDPPPGPGEARVRVKAIGVCGSDVTYYTEGRVADQAVRDPIPLGHEIAGIVEDVGPDVTNVAPGARVFVEPAIHCGKCEACRAGYHNMCHAIRFLGTPPKIPGAWREFLTWPAKNCLPVPSGMPLDEATLIEPFMVAMTSVGQLARPRPGETAAVFGCGTIGLFHILYAKIIGLRVICASDPLDYRLRIAKDFGAENTSSGGKSVVSKIMELTNGRGVDIALECAGHAESVDDAIQSAARGGRVIICGIPHEDKLAFDVHCARRKELVMINVRRSRADHGEAFRIATERRNNFKRFVTHRFPLDKTKDALETARDYKDGVVKAVIEP
jgi:L-iditol 2-dehydrogenase